jgi:hypothetical protein
LLLPLRRREHPIREEEIMVRNLPCALLLLASAAPALALDASVPGSYSSARFVTTDAHRVEVADVTLERDRLSFESAKKTGFNEDASSPVDIEEIRYLEVKTGTKAGKYALMGAAGGALGGLLATLRADQQDIGLSGSESGLLVMLTTTIPALIGAAVGSGSPVYTPVRKNNEWLDSSTIGMSPAPTPPAGIRAGLAFSF